MAIRSFLASYLAAYIEKKQIAWALDPVGSQARVFKNLIQTAKDTVFGKAHGFEQIQTMQDFARQVPIRDYEQLSGYIHQIIEGQNDVLWPGKPIYFAKTSGTTSGVKYIPLTSDSIPNHINGAKNALLSYVHETKNSRFLDKKMIFLSGSPVLDKKGNINTGRLSGIVNHHIPSYLRTNQLPSYATNCIEDWETKLDQIVKETISKPMSLISGIPPWVQMYFDRLTAVSGKSVGELFPDFSVFVYGGVNFEPYKKKLFDSIGRSVDSIELFPASEGFFAYQDSQKQEGLLLLLDAGIFYEFVPVEFYGQLGAPRLTIGEVQIGKNYAMMISNNAGLWAYDLGDTVEFVSTKPYRLKVSGRVKHFISAFGEHVIGQEVEQAIKYALQYHPEVQINEFTVAPQVSVSEGLPHHQWLIEFARPPANLPAFARRLDESMCVQNIYYNDLISGSILEPLQIKVLEPGAFVGYMKKIGKLGGQNKVPRLTNDRQIADQF